MKVAVIGGGAMGGIFAVRLANADVSVTVVDSAPEVLDAIRTNGVSVREGDKTQRSAVVAVHTLPVEAFDLVLVFVKSQHTAAVASMLRTMRLESTVVSLQNGWGNGDVLTQSVPPSRLVVGVTYHSGTVTSPGAVDHTGEGPTFVGPFESDGEMDRAIRAAELFTAAGIETVSTSEIRTEIWKKLILNAATLPVAALTRLRAIQMSENKEVLDLSDALATEAIEVARALGIAVEVDERLGRIHSVLVGAGMGKPSMLQDVEGHRKTEVETVSGAVVRAADQLGIQAPLNQAMVALVHGLEAGWSR